METTLIYQKTKNLKSQRILSSYWLRGLFVLFIGFFVIATSHANTKDPDVLIMEATTEMIAALNDHQSEIKANPDKLKSLVEKIILPHLDLITASKWVMGKYWRRAETKQKIKFIKAFRGLLLNFYSSALAQYLDTGNNKLDQSIFVYHPIREDLASKDVTVRATVKVKNGRPVPVKYSMHLTKKGWKIYDVSVEGISMITTYKNNFATELRQKGIDGLIASIEEKNRQLLADSSK